MNGANQSQDGGVAADPDGDREHQRCSQRLAGELLPPVRGSESERRAVVA